MYEHLDGEVKKLREPENPLLARLQELTKLVEAANAYPDKVRYQKELIDLLQNLLKDAPDNADLKTYVSNKYGGLAWYHLFARQFPEAEQAARQGITLGGEAATWIHTNLALALLYQGRYEEAKASYQQFKGKPYDEERNWTAVFLADLEELEKAGITHPDVVRARMLLEE